MLIFEIHFRSQRDTLLCRFSAQVFWLEWNGWWQSVQTTQGHGKQTKVSGGGWEIRRKSVNTLQ